MKKHDAEGAKKGDLIPYYLNGPNTPLLYNDIQVIPPWKGPIINEAGKKPEKAPKGPTGSTFKITGLEEW